MSGQLKEVRERIKSVKSTQQITKAMKMVSAAKLRRAQQSIVQMRPYAERLNNILINILTNLEGDADTVFGVERPVEKACIVVVTSNKGLCGAFNNNIIKEARQKIEQDYSELYDAGHLTIVPIGKKAYESFRKTHKKANILSDYVFLFNDLSFDQADLAAQKVMDSFQAGDFDEVYICYGRFKNAALQFAEKVQYLPVKKLEKPITGGRRASRADYIFEPGKNELLDQLIPTILRTTFYRFLLDTHASEHGARMTAMDNATENAEELLNELKINYNKARQEAITKELSEIVGGAAALQG
ncbi:MAG TPA: ATP synthase F1 subunit gamma [Saprospiraceae bacterium]|nr:ATP synthase F1 subunit gamma [Saprospiraceae bacterium]